MLTGDETRSSGNAYASGKDLDKSRTRFLSKIGYCPQFDGIIEVLSGLEMVQLFGRLRGVKRVKQESKSWMARVGKLAEVTINLAIWQVIKAHLFKCRSHCEREPHVWSLFRRDETTS